MIGKLFNNRYEIKEKLGSGGTAIVYRGLDTLLGRAVTIKILREEYASDEDFVRRFRREAQAVASLSHNNIVAVYDVGYEENMHYIVMEFVEGMSLKDMIKQSGAFQIDDAVAIITQILAGIQHAHEHGIIHRDIKPHNILIGKDGRAKVTDFGIAIGMTEMTQTYSTTSRIMGSVHYISPEQVQGLPVTEKSDIYSAAVVFYEMLTGQVPFAGDTPISIAMQHVQGELPLPHQVNPNVPIALSYVVMRAMRKNPDARYDSVQAFMEAIKAAVNESSNAGKEEEDQSLDAKLAEVFRTMDNDQSNNEITPLITDDKTNKKLHSMFDRNKKLFIIIGVALICVAMFAAIQLGLFLYGDDKVVVPDVVGENVDEAEQTLTDLGLDVSITKQSDEDVDKDLVISQSLEADQKVGKGRNIKLVVSSGSEEIEVPDVVGKTQEAAKKALEKKGLKVKVTEENSTTVDEGNVISQSPEAGESVSSGSTINIVVSLGTKAMKVTMPNLVGSSLSEAKKTINDSGLYIEKIGYTSSDEYYSGIVVAQSITAGTELEEGNYVTLTVSEGPGPSASTANVNYSVVDDGNNHQVKIVVSDSVGSREVYNNTVAGGTYISQTVTYYNKGKISIYVDGNLEEEHQVP